MKYNVYIDDGFVGTVDATSLQEARENAIKFYNIVSNQKVRVEWAGFEPPKQVVEDALSDNTLTKT